MAQELNKFFTFIQQHTHPLVYRIHIGRVLVDVDFPFDLCLFDQAVLQGLQFIRGDRVFDRAVAVDIKVGFHHLQIRCWPRERSIRGVRLVHCAYSIQYSNALQLRVQYTESVRGGISALSPSRWNSISSCCWSRRDCRACRTDSRQINSLQQNGYWPHQNATFPE